jgi:hypothetical protein
MYIIGAVEDDLFATYVEVGLEVLFESGVQKLDLEGSAVGKPVAEEQLATVHAVVAGVLQVEDAHPGLLGRKSLQEALPVALP